MAIVFALQHGFCVARFGPVSQGCPDPKSQNLRLNSGLWIKLEQFSEVRRKSLTGLMNFDLETC